MHEAIRLDYKEKKNRIIIQKELRKIGNLSEYPNGQLVPLEAIEELIREFGWKYKYEPHWITLHTILKENHGHWYSTNIRCGNHSMILSVYANTLYELWAKVLIAINAEITGNY